MIEKFITDIIVEDYYDDNFEFQQRFVFSGDGVGDFEKHHQLDVRKKVLEDYIKYCSIQLAYAKEFLEEKEYNNEIS